MTFSALTGSALFDVRLLRRVELHNGSIGISDLDEVTNRAAGDLATDDLETVQLVGPSRQVVGGQSQDVESFQCCDHGSLDLMQTQDDATRVTKNCTCLLYTSPSPRDRTRSRMPSSA